MYTYLAFFSKMAPLYLNIGLGFIAGKALDVSRDMVARLMFYIINPLIILNGVLSVQLDASILSLPVLTFLLSSSFCLAFYKLAERYWDDSTSNLVGFSAGSGNSGYFGIPLALVLFNNEGEGIYILAILGLTLYENTVGYYILAKGSHPPSECFLKVAKLPAIYAFFGGLVLNYAGVPVSEVFIDFMVHIKGTFTVLGMMIIGLGLAQLNYIKIDKLFIVLTFLAKFIIWPLTIFLLIALDKTYFHFYDTPIYNALILLSIVPVAVNTVIMASILNSQPEKAATAVWLSTLFAFIFVPWMLDFAGIPMPVLQASY